MFETLVSLLLIALHLEVEKKEWEAKYVAVVPPFNLCPQISEKADFSRIEKQGIRFFLKTVFCLGRWFLC